MWTMSTEANHEQEPRMKVVRMRNAVWGVSKGGPAPRGVSRHVSWVGPVCFNDIISIRKHPTQIMLSQFRINIFTFKNRILDTRNME